MQSIRGNQHPLRCTQHAIHQRHHIKALAISIHLGALSMQSIRGTTSRRSQSASTQVHSACNPSEAPHQGARTAGAQSGAIGIHSVVIKGDRTWALEQQAHDLEPALSNRMLEHLAHRARMIVRGWQVDENTPREAWLVPLHSEQQRALPREAISGNQWRSKAIDGNQWQSVHSARCRWKPFVPISGHQWPSVATSGHQWPPVAISGNQSHIVANSGNPACLCE